MDSPFQLLLRTLVLTGRRKVCSTFAGEYILTMKIAVLCYLRHKGRTLMIHRNARPDDMHFGKWNAPGGKLEAGETPEECVIREFHEETGLTLVDPRMRGVLTFPAFDGEDDWYVFVFTSGSYSGVLRESCPEGTLEWIDDSMIFEIPLWEGDHVFMKWLDSGSFFSGKFIYGRDGFQEYSVVFHGTDGS